MKTSDIKLFAMEYINLQDNISFDDKMTMIQFVTESDIIKVKSFLLTGQMRSLEEGESEFVETLFESSNMLTELPDMVTKGIKAVSDNSGAAIKALTTKWASFGGGDKVAAWAKHYDSATKAINKGAPVAGIVVSAMILMLARKAYKAYFTKAAKACKGKTGALKTECIRMFKIKAIEQEISILNSSKSACKSSTMPDKCMINVDKKIMKKKKDIQNMMKKKNPR